MEETRDESTPDLEDEQEDGGEPSRGFMLTEDDVEIFRLIYEYRFLRREQLSLLCGRSMKRLHRRLHKLVNNRFLNSIERPQKKHIYALGKSAIRALVERGFGEAELLAQRIRTSELKPLFLDHEMMIVDVHAILALASAQNDIKLIGWREGKSLYDSVPMQSEAALPVRPDAMFTLEDTRRPTGANRVHFFLEADRSSENQRRFTDKIRAYYHYVNAGMHVKKYNIKGFRVLTVTVTEARAENLCKLAAAVIPEGFHKYFLFTSLKQFSLDNPAPVFTPVYLSPRRPDERIPIIPDPVPLPTPAAVMDSS